MNIKELKEILKIVIDQNTIIKDECMIKNDETEYHYYCGKVDAYKNVLLRLEYE